VACLTVYETLMKGLADAVEAGLTKTVGVSNYNVEQVRRAYEALARRSVPLVSNQVEYSPRLR
jgi:diketogulonate reductase-like aldo/keto reductase